MAHAELRMFASALTRLRCPECGAGAGFLEGLWTGGRRCGCGFRFEVRDGIVRAAAGARRERYARFLDEYALVRAAEGRGSDGPEYYLALPYRDLTERNSWQWSIRARTYRFFERRILAAHEHREPLDILDLGAGTGWMSYRLACRGHRPIAVDLRTDERDGLGAARHYGARGFVFPRFEAEFDRLPFGDGQFDLAVFNAAFHYATDAEEVLREAVRCLKGSGRVVIMDTPIYRRTADGERMRAERRREFLERYGLRSDALASIDFLDDAAIAALGARLGIEWEARTPWYGLAWIARPWRARLAGRRPPSRFAILVGKVRP